MNRERIADRVFVFTAGQYAQETAGAILAGNGVILIDTLFFPEETEAIRNFIETRLNLPVRYVINTHYHADHTQGTYLFPEARVVSHALCRQLLDGPGREGLAQAQAALPELAGVKLVLPDTTFDGDRYELRLGERQLFLYHQPGHSPDLTSVYLPEEGILFASDNMMPVPTVLDGSFDDLRHSLNEMLAMNLQMIVQGHGPVILSGKVREAVETSLAYLDLIHEKVAAFIAAGRPAVELATISAESCGLSRLALNGLGPALHEANLRRLYAAQQGADVPPTDHG